MTLGSDGFPLVGRAREEQRLHEFLARVCAGGGGTIVLSGGPGLGKSFLLSRLAIHARDLGIRVLASIGVESESELPYWGLSELVVPIAAELDELPDPQRHAVSAAIGRGGPGAHERFAVYAALRMLLETVAESSPLLIAIDDAQWLDQPTFEALRFALRGIPQTRVGLVLAVRDGDGRAVDVAGADEISLTGLSATDSVTLLREYAPHVVEPVAHALYEATGGTPLALVELAQNLTVEQISGTSPLPEDLPTGRRLERVFARRLETLPGPTLRALLVAAASETGSVELIAGALSDEQIDASVLGPAENARLLTLERGHVVWRHPLARSAVLGAATPAERRSAHAALAGAADDGSRIADHRAWHLAAAADGPDEDVAHQLEELAMDAAARGAAASTARALAVAATLTPQPERRALRTLAAAEAAIVAGDGAGAVGLLDSRVIADAPATVRAEAELLRARVDIMNGVPQIAHDRVMRAASAIEQQAPGLASRMMAEGMLAQMATGDRDLYLATARRAFATGQRAGSESEALPGLLLGMGMLADGAGAEALELLERYQETLEQPALWSAAPEVAGMLVMTQVWAGRHDAAERLIDRMIAAGQALGSPRALAFPYIVRADICYRTGRWPQALAAAQAAVSFSSEIAQPALLATNQGYLARIEAGLGRVADARDHAHHALEACMPYGLNAVAFYSLHALGHAALSLGELESAATTFAQFDALDSWAAEPGLALWRADHAETLLRLGREQDARAIIEALRGDSEHTGRDYGLAVVARLDGMLAEENFDAHFSIAAAAHARADMPFETARTQFVYGERLRRARRKREAADQLSAARDTFAALGAKVWLARTQRELQATGVRVDTPARESPWGELTAQETNVAELITSGATYREAAAQLFLSPRTIESHLRTIYRKLGVRSRSELIVLLGTHVPAAGD